MKITFLGAAETVTGSRYLLTHNGKKILVDCGLFQGHKEMRQRNWAQFPIDPRTIDALVLTHAHLDHTGYIPLLVKNGFSGKIFCSEATFDLCKILLPDSGFLQEEDAERANRHNYSKHSPALPLYTEADAQQSLKKFQPVAFNTKQAFGDTFDAKQKFDEDFYFTLSNSGHILGSAFVTVFYDNQSIVFSGDLGRANDAIMKPPAPFERADYLLIESTYGNRLHEKTDPAKILKEVINKTVARGGSVVIPAFAVGRAQNIMFYLHQLKQEKAIPDLPIFLDSPMAVSAAKILQKHADEHKLGEKLCDEICETVRYIRSVDESKNLAHIKMPVVIISASGMAEGGRVLHHLKNYISDHKNTILFTGFQAAGTRGNKILRGDREIKIHGQMYSVNAEIVNLGNSSAHADYAEILDWLSNFKSAPKKTFITHGSIESATALKEKIEKNLVGM